MNQAAWCCLAKVELVRFYMSCEPVVFAFTAVVQIVVVLIVISKDVALDAFLTMGQRQAY